LARAQGDVVREHDLAIVTANDSFAPGQLDQDGSHDLIVATGTTQSTRTETDRTSVANFGLNRMADAANDEPAFQPGL
jgi:hypothetical protein